MLNNDATQYAANGWRVHPLRERGKSPLLKNWPVLASSDIAITSDHWEKFPDANIGLVTDGLLVVDLDGKTGVQGFHAIAKKYGGFPTCPVSLTGGGGVHLFFAAPEGVPPKNSAGQLGAGIDTRWGRGGYVVVPPSVHANGARYKWRNNGSLFDLAPPPAPEWLMSLLVSGANGNDKFAVPGGGTSWVEWHKRAAGQYGQGQRNDIVCRLTGHMLRPGKDGPAVGVLFELMRAWNALHCTPPLPEEEVETIVTSLREKEFGI